MEIILEDVYELHSRKGSKIKLDVNPGIYYLMGSNGSGKTTTLLQIKEFCIKNKYKYLHYNNLSDGGNNMIGLAINSGHGELAASMMCSSEGQQIRNVIFNYAPAIGQLSRKETNKPIFLLLDAFDSGLDIPGCYWLVEAFKLFTDNSPNLYIFVTFNNYAMIENIQNYSNSHIINVRNGKEEIIKSYKRFSSIITKMGSKINNDKI